MPIVDLTPGRCLSLGPREEISVKNDTPEEGRYTIAPDGQGVVAEHIIAPGQTERFTTGETGIELCNRGPAPLQVTTPGL